MITNIYNWHLNSSFPAGQDPATVGGTISILDYPSGTVRGVWDASPHNGNLAWQVFPNIVLPAGSYQIVESQTGPSSWSYTTTGGSPQWEAFKGMSQVSAAPVTPNNGSVLAMSFNGSIDAYTLGSPVTTATDNFGIEAWVRNYDHTRPGTPVHRLQRATELSTGFGLSRPSTGAYHGHLRRLWQLDSIPGSPPQPAPGTMWPS